MNDGAPSFSPDGTQIIFSRADGIGGSDIYVMPAPGAAAAASAFTAAAQPLTTIGNADDPNWGPRVEGAPTTAVLTVTRVGSSAGRGVVISQPQGIRCGIDCSEELPLGTAVRLTALPRPGAVFAGWFGDACAGVTATVCNVTLDGDKNVLARFVRSAP